MTKRIPDNMRRPTPRLAARKGGPRIPAESFIRWCEMKVVQYGGPEALRATINSAGRFMSDSTGARDQLADDLGIAPRTLWRYMHWRDSCGRPTTVAPRWFVEDMLARAGVDFYSVYPSLAFERDIELEPDAWCRCCREFVTPIFGLCPWDDTPVGMELAA